MTHTRPNSILSLAAAFALLACSSSSDIDSASGTAAPPTINAGGSSASANGGQTNSQGGVAQQGGSAQLGGSNSGTGGSAQSGGSATGGSSAIGGGSTLGGSTVGGKASGGATMGGVGTGGLAAGGSVALGGVNVTAGGASTTGGAPSAGGKATGGSATGGKAAGGTMATGGAAVTAGGATTTGTSGSGNTGGCVESTCGSHKWPCWRIPTPVSEGLPNAQSYTDLGNGAVRDNITCLVWEKANSSTQGDWQAASDRCASLASSSYAGFSDWRLPTRVEMASISDVTLGSKGFPTALTTSSGYYTTKSYWYKTILSPSTTNMVWGYGTNGFTSNAIVITDANKVVRCVRGNGTGEAYNEYAKEPANHYTVTGSGVDATVKDNYTGLIWQQTYSSARMAWSAAKSYCASQTTGGLSGWRVPTLNELASTVNEALVAPAINRTVFPSTNGSCDPDGWFWASEASKVGGEAWGLSYCDGYTGWNGGADSSKWNYFVDGWVRCVHN